jgi:hypothetical protein
VNFAKCTKIGFSKVWIHANIISTPDARVAVILYILTLAVKGRVALSKIAWKKYGGNLT